MLSSFVCDFQHSLLAENMVSYEYSHTCTVGAPSLGVFRKLGNGCGYVGKMTNMSDIPWYILVFIKPIKHFFVDSAERFSGNYLHVNDKFTRQ